MARIYFFLGVLMVLSLSPPFAISQQNNRVSWYAFDAGFRSTGDADLSFLSAVGQQFVGATIGFETMIQSGFLADTLLRGAIVAVDEPKALPGVFELSQNYPNPFNPLTVIRFDIARSSHVRLSLYTVLGQEIALLVDDELDAGTHAVTLDSRLLASGVYFYRMTADGFSGVRKLVVAK